MPLNSTASHGALSRNSSQAVISAEQPGQAGHGQREDQRVVAHAAAGDDVDPGADAAAEPIDALGEGCRTTATWAKT